MKITWKVSSVLTGRYRSFQKREWPSAEINDCPAFSIHCADAYIPANVRDGSHGELTLRLAVYDGARFEWRNFRQRFPTLSMAKDYANSYVQNHPEIYNENFGSDPDDAKKKVVLVYHSVGLNETLVGIYVDLAAARHDYPGIKVGGATGSYYAEEHELKG